MMLERTHHYQCSRVPASCDVLQHGPGGNFELRNCSKAIPALDGKAVVWRSLKKPMNASAESASG